MTFIVIEGVAGASKKIQTQLLADALKNKHQKIVETISFPQYDHRWATFVDKFMAGEFGHLSQVDPYIASTFYMIDRFAHKQVLEKKLAVYDYVISDRYSISSFIHRWAFYLAQDDQDGLREFFSWLYDLEFQKAKLPLPDVIIFLAFWVKHLTQFIQEKEQERLLRMADVGQAGSAYDGDYKDQQFALLIGREILPSYFSSYHIVDCEDEQGVLLSEEMIHQKIMDIVF